MILRVLLYAVLLSGVALRERLARARASLGRDRGSLGRDRGSLGRDRGR